MTNRARDIVNLAIQAGLEAVEAWRDSRGRFCIKAQAGNGLIDAFSISAGPKADPKGDLHALGRMKRFARQNPAPQGNQAETINLIPPQETVKKPIEPAAASASRSTLTLNKAPAEIKTGAEPTVAAQELTMAEFYKLCEWIKATPLLTHASCATASIAISSVIGQAVSEETFRHAMEVTGTMEPESWNPPKKPELVIARQLSALLEAIGEKPMVDFERLAKSLETQ